MTNIWKHLGLGFDSRRLHQTFLLKNQTKMKDSKLTKKEKIKLVKAICEEECNYIYMEKDIDISFNHYSPDVHTVYLRENPKTINRVTHKDVKHIQDRIQNEVSDRWYLGLLISRPELFAWYTGEDEENDETEPLY